MNAHVAVVRHVPDPVRDEPRNVGVILLCGDMLRARFLGEDALGRLNLRRVRRAMIADRSTYREWVSYWRKVLDAGEVEHSIEDRIVSAGEGRVFLTALSRNTTGNYQVRLGGEVYAPGGSLDGILDDIYTRVVSRADQATADAIADAAPTHKSIRNSAYRVLRSMLDEREVIKQMALTGRTREGSAVPTVFDLGVIPSPEMLKPEEQRRLLLLDAISLYGDDDTAIIDRARSMAVKAMEATQARPDVTIRAVTSNGQSSSSRAGKYALDVLREEGQVTPITVDDLEAFVPRIRQGQLDY